MEYTIEQVNQMLEGLRALPAIDTSKRKLNKQGAVKVLAEEIANLQRRGYTIEQVTESLHGVGLDISTPTLKSYLQRTKIRRGKGGKKTAARTAPATPAAAGARAATAGSGGREASAATAAPGAKDAKAERPGAPVSTRSEFMTKDREKL